MRIIKIENIRKTAAAPASAPQGGKVAVKSIVNSLKSVVPGIELLLPSLSNPTIMDFLFRFLAVISSNPGVAVGNLRTHLPEIQKALAKDPNTFALPLAGVK
jgi:hypothetical protein